MTKYPFIPVNIPLLDGNEKEYLNECIDTGWISSEGQFVNQFEDQFANRLGRKLCHSSNQVEQQLWMWLLKLC